MPGVTWRATAVSRLGRSTPSWLPGDALPGAPSERSSDALAPPSVPRSCALRAAIVRARTSALAAPGPHAPVFPPSHSPVQAGRRRCSRLILDDTHQPLGVSELAQALPARSYRTLAWREGRNAPLRSRFAWVRVRAADADRPRGAGADATPRPVVDHHRALSPRSRQRPEPASLPLLRKTSLTSQ